MLFQIKWNSIYNHYFLNAGAYDDEQVYDARVVKITWDTLGLVNVDTPQFKAIALFRVLSRPLRAVKGELHSAA